MKNLKYAFMAGFSLLLFNAASPLSSAAQTGKTDSKIYESVDVVPEFPGGVNGYMAFLAKTIRYPAEGRRKNIQGRVIVTFVVEKNGSISDVKSLRSPDAGLAQEAVRAVAASPRWKPGMIKNKKVRVQYTVPVVFSLAK